MLILTEKPSVAKSFADALGAARNKAGFYENSQKGVVITNCVGHLYELAKPAEYNEAYRRFSFENLPILPKTFVYAKTVSTERQTVLVTKLLQKHRDDRIIIATDADREGEVIARIVLREAGITDTTRCRRFWVSEALTPDVIRKGMNETSPWSEYETLARQGFARQHADWLVGMNLTPYMTLLSGNRETFPVGRVQTAILAAVAQRNKEVKNFVPVPYYECAATLRDHDGNKTEALLINPESGKTFFMEQNAYIKTAKNWSDTNKDINVTAETKRKTLNPPRLLSLTALQKIAAKDFDYSASKTLEIAQKLYEEYKCLSYPRTPSDVLGDDDVALFREVFDRLKGLHEISKYCDINNISQDNKHIFNSKRLESHHALIPLSPMPENASQAEKNIYDTVTRHFFLCCMPPFVYDEKTLLIKNGEYTYKAVIKSTVDAGWKNADKDADDDISAFNEKSAALLSVEILKKYTTPKKEFTETSLLSFMENPTGENSDEKLVGLGTPATRGSILKKLGDDGYIRKEGKKLIATDKGVFLLRLLFKNELTAKIAGIKQTTLWEKQLSESPETFEESIVAYVRQTVTQKQAVETFEKEGVGVCPLCGKKIMESEKSYYCTGWKADPKCGFAIWKSIMSAKISLNDAKLLLSGKTTGAKKLTKKDGSTFSAKLKLDAGEIKFVFDKKNFPRSRRN